MSLIELALTSAMLSVGATHFDVVAPKMVSLKAENGQFVGTFRLTDDGDFIRMDKQNVEHLQ